MIHPILSKAAKILASAAIGLSACLGLGSAAHAQSKPLNKPVTIAVGTTVINATYPWLTLPIVLGYWKEEGYDVKVVTTGGSLQGIQQMVAGSVDFVQVDSAPMIQANTDNDVAVRGVMNTLVIDWGIGVLKDGPMRSIADFKGQKIGVFSLGTGGMPLLKGYLRANGIDPDKDVQIIATGAGAPALEALRTNRVQGLMFWGSALTGFQNAGLDMRVLFNPEWRKLPGFSFGTLQKTIDSDPVMVEAIARGAAKATLYAQTNPDCARQIHWKNYPSTKPTGADEATLAKWDLALLQTTMESMKAAHDMNGGQYIGAMDPAAFGRMQDFMQTEKMIKRTLPPESMLYLKPGFIEAVNRFDHDAVVAAAKACKGL